MFKFFEALKTKSSSKKITAAIGEAEAALSAARDALGELNARRGPLLLEGTDAAVDKIEAEIATKTREIDRLNVGIESGRERLAEASASEAAAALDKTLAAADAESQKGVELLAEYSNHSEAIRKILIELDAINRVVGSANQAAVAAGDNRQIDKPLKIVHVNSGTKNPQYEDLTKIVVLPRPGEMGQYFWLGADSSSDGIEKETQIIELAEAKSA